VLDCKRSANSKKFCPFKTLGPQTEKKGVRGTELRVARGSVVAEAPLPLRAQSKSQFGFVPRDTENSEFLDLVHFGGVEIPMETVKYHLQLSDGT